MTEPALLFTGLPPRDQSSFIPLFFLNSLRFWIYEALNILKPAILTRYVTLKLSSISSPTLRELNWSLGLEYH